MMPKGQSLFPYSLICVCAVVAFTGGCRRHAETSAPAPLSVTIMQPVEKPVTENLDLTGTVAASLSVNLVARVSGYLESVNFKDGDFVEKDQLLFVIVTKPYRSEEDTPELHS